MEIICYACGKGEFPENSLEGIQNCQDVHADLKIEMDVQLTADNKLVLFHDSTTLRTTGRDYKVEELALKELEKLNIAHSFYNHSKMQFSKAPTLQEVFHSFPQIHPIIDISTSNKNIIPILYNVLKDHPRHQEFIIVSAHDDILKLCKKAFPKNRMAAGSMEVKKLLLSCMSHLDRWFPLQSDLLMMPEYLGKFKILTSGIINHSKNNGKKIYIWKREAPVELVDSIEDYLTFKNKSIDGIFTSRPRDLYSALHSS